MDIKHNWVPTHSYPQGCGYSKVYEHQVPLECDGVYYQSMQWAAEKVKTQLERRGHGKET